MRIFFRIIVNVLKPTRSSWIESGMKNNEIGQTGENVTLVFLDKDWILAQTSLLCLLKLNRLMKKNGRYQTVIAECHILLKDDQSLHHNSIKNNRN